MRLGEFKIHDQVWYEWVNKKGKMEAVNGKIIGFTPSGKVFVQRVVLERKKLVSKVDQVSYAMLWKKEEPRP